MKPILFNTKMVRAIRDGRKTVTRRVVRPQPKGRLVSMPESSGWPGYFGVADTPRVISPPYFVGDILYVRETWCNANTAENPCYFYKADGDRPHDFDELTPWHPSIHMPKEAARLFLRVKDVRVQQLKDVTEADARAEGFGSRAEFIATILKMYPDTTEESWFWVIEFERISKEEAL